MTETTDRPLVTFALFAYNQEQYIREAVEGAFSQTYEPLEIILSDDCSTDRTFEIMQEMAAAYKGPHEVRVRRNSKNIGTIDHVISVAGMASGEFMVVAAGDDVSCPDRTDALADAWISNREIMAAFSLAHVMSADGHITHKNLNSTYKPWFQKVMAKCANPKKYNGGYRNIPGYSAAYRTDIVKELPLSGEKLLNEDSLLSYYINCCGGEIAFIERPLVHYRSNFIAPAEGETYSERHQRIIRQERKSATFAKSTARFYVYLFNLLRAARLGDADTVISYLKDKRRLAEVQSRYLDSSISERARMLLTSYSPQAFRYGLPRILGPSFFSYIKSLASRR